MTRIVKGDNETVFTEGTGLGEIYSFMQWLDGGFLLYGKRSSWLGRSDSGKTKLSRLKMGGVILEMCLSIRILDRGENG